MYFLETRGNFKLLLEIIKYVKTTTIQQLWVNRQIEKNDFIRVAITKFHDRLNELNRMWSDRTDADGQ